MSVLIGIWVAVMSYLIINCSVKSIQQKQTAKLNDKYIKEKIVFSDEQQTQSVKSECDQKETQPVKVRYTLSLDDPKKVTKTVEYHGLKIEQPDSKASLPHGELFTVRDYKNNFIGYVYSIEGPGSYHTVSGEFEVMDPTVLQYFYNCINSGFYQDRIKFSLSNTKCELTGCLVTAIHQDDINEKMSVTIVADKMDIKKQNAKAERELWDDNVSAAWNKTYTCNIPMRTMHSNAYGRLYDNRLCTYYHEPFYYLKE